VSAPNDEIDERLQGEYEVGYGKPPLNTRFRQGASGNPKGRPKGKLKTAALLSRALNEKVIVNENCHRRAITKKEAMLKQLVNKSASGELPALKQLLPLMTLHEQSPEPEASIGGQLEPVDDEILRGILERYKSSLKNGSGDD
jgi:hypothetical protein